MGYNDPNLNNAIINIQRLIRKQQPIVNRLTLQDVDEQMRDPDFDDECISVLNWHSYLIPEIIKEEINGNSHSLTFTVSGILDVDVHDLINDFKKRLVFTTVNDTDLLFKIACMMSWHDDGNLFDLRHSSRDQLKFITVECSIVDIREFIAGVIHSVSCPVVNQILGMLDSVKPSPLLLEEFKRLKIRKLNEDSLRKWFLLLVFDDYDKISSNQHNRLRNYIEGKSNYKADRNLVTRLLTRKQRLIREGKQITTLQIISEDVTINHIIV